MRTIVALTGLPGSGKSEVRRILEHNHRFAPVRVAAPLKRMLSVLGCTDRYIEGDLKELPTGLLGGATPRRMMQVLGREVPDAIGVPDLWAWLWRLSVNETPSERIVVEDHRYPNEMIHFRKAGMVSVWNVQRNNTTVMLAKDTMLHQAENQRLHWDMQLFNDDTLDALEKNVAHKVSLL